MICLDKNFSKAQKSLAELIINRRAEELKAFLSDISRASLQDVVFIATRWIVKPPKNGSAFQRPRSRTLLSMMLCRRMSVILLRLWVNVFDICSMVPKSLRFSYHFSSENDYSTNISRMVVKNGGVMWQTSFFDIFLGWGKER
ncbi:hypothetical protein L1987_18635 [Smallanthus sonchifolius]|uniref:Uncharacterized protein n=1 Tax=Smallanthus sonchifolius TaxID=185202 RepID=A0ACB9J0U9_9ASTR|nr:hypothetical protein L1987_18635 [Smallanthus sonchifolius]